MRGCVVELCALPAGTGVLGVVHNVVFLMGAFVRRPRTGNVRSVPGRMMT